MFDRTNEMEWNRQKEVKKIKYPWICFADSSRSFFNKVFGTVEIMFRNAYVTSDWLSFYQFNTNTNMWRNTCRILKCECDFDVKLAVRSPALQRNRKSCFEFLFLCCWCLRADVLYRCIEYKFFFSLLLFPFLKTVKWATFAYFAFLLKNFVNASHFDRSFTSCRIFFSASFSSLFTTSCRLTSDWHRWNTHDWHHNLFVPCKK